ncbi:MAG TPA: O-antigen ligase family protein [Chloroflexota bacterium]
MNRAPSGGALTTPLRTREIPAGTWVAGLTLVILAATIPGIWSLGGLVVLIAGAAVIVNPDLAIYLLTLSVPLGSMLEVDTGSFSLSPTEGIAAMLLIGWAARAFARGRFVVPLAPLLLPIVAVIAVHLFSMQQAVQSSLTIKETLKWVELLLVYAYVIAEMGTMPRAMKILGFLFAGATIEGLIGLVQFGLGLGPAEFAIGRFMRAFGTFEQPNPYAGYLGMLLPLAIAMLLTRPAGRFRNGIVLVLSVALVGVAASLSRGAWVGVGLGVVAMMVFWSRRSRLLVAIAVIAMVPVLALAFLNVLPAEVTVRLATALDYFRFIDVRNEIVTPDNWAVLERVAHWQAALDMIAAHPIFGVGAGNYPAVYQQYMVSGWLEPLGHAHNYYLNVAAETGLPGLAIYLVFLTAAFLTVIRALVGNPDRRAGEGTGVARDEEVKARAILLGTLGMLVAISVHNLFDNLFVHGMGLQLGMILALAQVAAISLARSDQSRGEAAR